MMCSAVGTAVGGRASYATASRVLAWPTVHTMQQPPYRPPTLHQAPHYIPNQECDHWLSTYVAFAWCVWYSMSGVNAHWCPNHCA